MSTDKEIWIKHNDACHPDVDMDVAMFTLTTLQLEVLLDIRRLLEEKK